MSPRLRNHIRRSQPGPELGPEFGSMLSSGEVATRGSENTLVVPATKGFLSLPPDLIYQVLSHFKEIRTEHILGNTNYINNSIPVDFLTRLNVLRALSQLSRLSRSIYLPLLWERFQACLVPDSGWIWTWENYIGKMVERKSKGLLESEHLWPYVKIVTISICWPRWSGSLEALSVVAQLLEVLPNVHTLEILPTGTLFPQSLETCFGRRNFPTIQNAVLPTSAHAILQCCTKVRQVMCNEGDGIQLVGALVHTGCSNLEVLRGVMIRPAQMKRLAKVKPPLKCVRIDNLSNDLTEDAILALSAFRSLRVIEIECRESKNIDQMVKLASEVLRKCVANIQVENSRNLRRTTRNARSTNPRSTSPERRLVRILRYGYGTPASYRTPPYFIPVRIEVFRIET